jgi:hypothetical protein
MSDFNSRFNQGLNNMKHSPGYLPSPSPVPTQASGSIWQNILDYLKGDPTAQAVPTSQVEPKPVPIDPYENINNRIKGLPYR